MIPRSQLAPAYQPHTDERTAFARLQEFLALRRLRIVTTVPDAVGATRYPPTDPRHFELRVVTRLKVLTKGHRQVDKVVAWADDETSCQGTPSAVLWKCTEWARFLEAEKAKTPRVILPDGSVRIVAEQARAAAG